jgi:hypothetical protein
MPPSQTFLNAALPSPTKNSNNRRKKKNASATAYSNDDTCIGCPFSVELFISTSMEVGISSAIRHLFISSKGSDIPNITVEGLHFLVTILKSDPRGQLVHA